MRFTASALVALCLPFLIALGSRAPAQEMPVVVELFTSQGCSSCPPADALMHDLAERRDVIGLALHVDYWDYIGWKDEFADPSHTVRQKAYARAGGRRMIYTPQMIVNGQDSLVGAKAMKLADLIAAHRRTAPRVQLDLTRDPQGGLQVALAPGGAPLTGAYDVVLVRFAPLMHSRITRGENAGRNLDYANIVRSWQVLGQWDGRGPAAMQATMAGDLPGVVLVQQSGIGPIVAAGRAN